MKKICWLALFSVLILSLFGIAIAAPGTPENLQPGENSVSVPLNPTFRWNLAGFDPATMNFRFYLYEGIGTGGTLVESRDNWWAESYYLSTLLNEDADYSWQVVAVEGGEETPGPVWSFHTQKTQASGNREPYPASEPTPADLSDKIPLSQVLSWTGGDPDLTDPYPLYYTVEIGTDPASMAPVASDIQVNRYVPTLDLNTTYYWRVTTRDSLGAENSGPTWSFTTVKEFGTNQPPTVPVAVDPTNGATGVPVTKTLRWGECTDPDGDSLTYDVYLGTNAGTFAKVASDLLVPMYDLPGTTPYDTVHYWKVVAKDGILSTSSSIWSFKTEQEPAGPVNRAPNAPVALDPTNGATGVPITKTLRWECSDPDGDTLAYDVYLGTNAATFTKVASDVLVPMYDLPGTTPYNTVHYWMVLAKDPDGLSTSGAIWTFKTEQESASTLNHAPNSPVAVDPTNGATGVSLTKTLRWEATDPDGDTPLRYNIWIGSSAGTFSKRNGTELTVPLFDLGDISPVADTLYYWQIEVLDPDDASTLGPIWTFSTAGSGGSGIGVAPNVPSAFDPADKAKSVPVNKSFTWICTDPDGQTLTYEVWMGRNLGDFTMKASGLTNPLYTPSSKLNYDTTYYWKIVAVDPDGNRTETPILSFTTFTEAEDPNLEGGLAGGGCSAAPLGGLAAMALLAGLALVKRRN